MKITKFTVGNFAVNNYLIQSEHSQNALLIDAGEDPDPILQKIRELNLKLVYLINTHGHGDHIAGNRKIIEATGAQLLIHELDAPCLTDPYLNLSIFFGFELHSPSPHRILKENDLIELDDISLRVIHTPGHTPGHITLVGHTHAFVGDVIFEGSIGRTDLPAAYGQQLIDTIRTKIYSLPDETILHPGHGPDTTVGREKYSNPFVSV
ncbi:MAG: MBL fold metallo-hydrolase [Calditrichia bacterium]